MQGGGGTGILPPPQWVHDSPHITVSGEAIRSAENTRNLRAAGAAPSNPAGGAHSTPPDRYGGTGYEPLTLDPTRSLSVL